MKFYKSLINHLTSFADYTVAGVENGNECWCDHTFGQYGRIDEKYCDKPCGGDPNLKCGGRWALGIFSREVHFYTIGNSTIE